MNGSHVANIKSTEPAGLDAPDGLRARLREQFDAVVMLTWSDWKTEPRSNRYHFATRFAEWLPVVFVQPMFNNEDDYHFEATQCANITLLHFPDRIHYDARSQINMLGAALNEKGILRPLLWVYNPFLRHFMRVCYSPLKIYHATEDYFDPHLNAPRRTIDYLKNTVREADLLVAVTQGVADSYQKHTESSGRVLVACNGVDYRYYAANGAAAKPAPAGARNVAFYQGGINWRLDFDLMRDTMKELPAWDFVIAGRIRFGEGDQARQNAWKKLLAMPNCRFLGELSIEALREQMHGATVGLIPFANSQSTREFSLPLKAFEYVACGLPVVSVPLTELQNHPFRDVFTFAETAGQFAQCIRDSVATRADPEKMRRRDDAARGASYDQTFDLVCRAIVETPRQPVGNAMPLTMLVLYGSDRTPEKALEKKLLSFRASSRHAIYFAMADGERACPYDLSHFDAVLVCSCLDAGGKNPLSSAYRRALKEHAGLKILLVGGDAEAPVHCVQELGIQLTSAELEWTEYPRQLIERIETLLGKGMKAPGVASARDQTHLPEPPHEYRTPPLRIRQRVRRLVLHGVRSVFGKAVARTVDHTWIPKLIQAVSFFTARSEV